MKVFKELSLTKLVLLVGLVCTGLLALAVWWFGLNLWIAAGVCWMTVLLGRVIEWHARVNGTYGGYIDVRGLPLAIMATMLAVILESI